MRSSDAKGRMACAPYAIAWWLAGMALLAVLAFPAGAFSIVSPVEGGLYASSAITVLHTAQGNCTAGWAGMAFPLAGCANFTMNAHGGENILWVSDGRQNATVRFTVVEDVQASEKAPHGLVVRGKTPYRITAVYAGAEGSALQRVNGLGGKGKQRIELEGEGRIRKVVLRDVAMPQVVDIGLEELADPPAIEGAPPVDGIAIDPTRVAFANGTLTKQAVGNTVWKCADWDFTAAQCRGDWAQIARVTPGQAYDIDFGPLDPAYVETFDDGMALDISVIALDDATLAIGWISSDPGNSAKFEIWGTAGALLTDQVTVDGTGDAGSRISLEAINRTHFSVAVMDGPEDDVDIYVYDRSGSLALGPAQADPSAGVNTDIGACQLGDRFAVVWADNNDNDANYEIWSNAGAPVFAESQVDTVINPGAAGQNLVDCAAAGSTQWGYAFFDDADNDISFSVVLDTGAIQVPSTDMDTNVGETGQVALASVDGRYAVVFYDAADRDITMAIVAPAGSALSTVLAATDIDTDAGASSRVAAAEIRRNGTAGFVVAWQDTASGDVKAAVYGSDGAQVTAPFTVASTPASTNPLLDVAGYSPAAGTGLCDGTFAIAYTNASGAAVFETYHVNGTRWGGECGAPDTSPPVISLVAPGNGTINTTSNLIDFLYSVSDANNIANCSLVINGAVEASAVLPVRDIEQNISVQLDNAAYEWGIACWDSLGNTNMTELRTLTVDVPPIILGADVRLAALDNTTLVIAYIDSAQDDASFEIWHTNGTRLLLETDVDTTVDEQSRIAVEAINRTHFGIAAVDGPEDDIDLYIYDRWGAPILEREVDSASGTSTDVGICRLGDWLAVVWADNNDNDANYEIWDSAGNLLVAENHVDAGITPGATGQNLVDCAAFGTAEFAYAFFDDADNDVSVASVLDSGSVSAVTDVDTGAGETGQVAVAGMDGRFAVAFYDAADDDITITVMSSSGGAFSTILPQTDIDTDAGVESRVAAAGIGPGMFVVAWQDTASGDVKAAVYGSDGAQVTAPFVVGTSAGATQPLLDAVGSAPEPGIGLCDGTFAIAYTNSSGNTIFRTYHHDGTLWDGQCGAPPAVVGISVPERVVLNAGAAKWVECNVSASDADGGGTIISANATLQLSGYFAADDPAFRYTNSSCAVIDTSGPARSFACGFGLHHFARNGTWHCEVAIVGPNYDPVFSTTSTVVDPLYALTVQDPALDFGSLLTGQASSEVAQVVSNAGNMDIAVAVYGYGRVPGDGNALDCGAAGIPVDAVRFSAAAGVPYGMKQGLASSPQQALIIPRPLGFSVRQNTSYWQLRVPPDLPVTGRCNGTVVFHAQAE